MRSRTVGFGDEEASLPAEALQRIAVMDEEVLVALEDEHAGPPDLAPAAEAAPTWKGEGCRTGHSDFAAKWSNFRGLVLGCIGTDLCK